MFDDIGNHSRTKIKVLKSLEKFFTLSIFSLAIVACGKQEQAAVKAPPPAVSVYKVVTEEIGDYREFVARTEASKLANLRARVEGELIERSFDEGKVVQKDQVLLKIDPAAYFASLAEAKASLKSKIAGAQTAKRNLARGKEVAGDGFISQSDLDKLTTEAAQTQAAVKAAEAALEKAELDLSYTTISAPFEGRIGKVNFNTGNVVGPNSGTLVTVTSVDPIHVTFQLEESDYVSYLQNKLTDGALKTTEVDISLRLPNNSEYHEKGRIDFADTKIEEGMGTVGLRAVFDNPNGIIVPGLFVTLIAETANKEQMALVPQAAVQENQQGKFVLVVDDSNTVSQRHVVLGRRINAMWVVNSGLVSNDLVIVEGLQKVRPGVVVKPVIKNIDKQTGAISDQTSH